MGWGPWHAPRVPGRRGQHPTGQHPTGQHPTGQHPTGQHPAGARGLQTVPGRARAPGRRPQAAWASLPRRWRARADWPGLAPRWRTRAAWAGLAVGAGLLGLAALVVAATLPRPINAGVVPRDRPPVAGNHGAAFRNGAGQRGQAPSGRGLFAVPDPETGPPSRVRVPALGIDATVVPVRRTGGGDLSVPANPRVLGWWAQGAVPGAPEGTAVIDGHVDSAVSGPGALFRLRYLRPGDRIKVTGPQGTLDYTVVALREYSKRRFPASQLFSQHVAGRLLIITCGGPFDQSTLSYLDNVAVYAVPAARHAAPAGAGP